MGIRGPSELAEEYHLADLLVLPSFADCLPSVVTEAFLCGTPVVAGAVCGVPEQIGPYGLTVPPGDSVALANAMETNCRSAALAGYGRPVRPMRSKLQAGNDGRQPSRTVSRHDRRPHRAGQAPDRLDRSGGAPASRCTGAAAGPRRRTGAASMNISHISVSTLPVLHRFGGAIERRIVEIAHEQARRGHRVSVYWSATPPTRAK